MSSNSNYISENAREELYRQTLEAQGLPGSVYTDPQFYELERSTLFAGSWVAAMVAAEIPNAGCAIPRTIAGWPLLFVRDRQGQLRCFHNICRHRGMAVLNEPCEDLHALRCPWHGWMYDLEGHLKGTPEFAGPETHDLSGFDKSLSGLVPVRIEQWFDFVFVNIDGRAPALEEFLAPLRERFAAFDDFSMFRYAQSWHHTYDSNWKISVEGAIEDYHLSWLHPQVTLGHKRADKSVYEQGGDCFFAVRSESEHLKAGRGSKQAGVLPRVSGITGPDARSTTFLNIFPTGVMGVALDGLYTGVWLPDGPHRTQLSFHFYFVGDEGAKGGDHEHARQHWINIITNVFEQDTPVVKAVQDRAAIRDRLGIRTRFSPYWETGVQRFQQLVYERVSAA